MQRMRDILQGSLGKTLAPWSPQDRLAAAWPVAVGHAIAAHSNVIQLEGSIATVHADDAAWEQQLRAMKPRLLADLARISRVPLTDILFTSPSNTRSRTPRQ